MNATTVHPQPCVADGGRRCTIPGPSPGASPGDARSRKVCWSRGEGAATNPHAPLKSIQLQGWEFVKTGTNQSNRWTHRKKLSVSGANSQDEIDRFGPGVRVGGGEVGRTRPTWKSTRRGSTTCRSRTRPSLPHDSLHTTEKLRDSMRPGGLVLGATSTGSGQRLKPPPPVDSETEPGTHPRGFRELP